MQMSGPLRSTVGCNGGSGGYAGGSVTKELLTHSLIRQPLALAATAKLYVCAALKSEMCECSEEEVALRGGESAVGSSMAMR
ncbi:MAG: hypothetical protein SGPRY_009915 [Prymnesium sp.]